MRKLVVILSNQSIVIFNNIGRLLAINEFSTVYTDLLLHVESKSLLTLTRLHRRINRETSRAAMARSGSFLYCANFTTACGTRTGTSRRHLGVERIGHTTFAGRSPAPRTPRPGLDALDDWT